MGRTVIIALIMLGLGLPSQAAPDPKREQALNCDAAPCKVQGIAPGAQARLVDPEKSRTCDGAQADCDSANAPQSARPIALFSAKLIKKSSASY